MSLRNLRKQKKLTQIECAKYLGIPVRTYQNNDIPMLLKLLQEIASS